MCVCVCVKLGAAARESLRRDRAVGLTSPATCDVYITRQHTRLIEVLVVATVTTAAQEDLVNHVFSV